METEEFKAVWLPLHSRFCKIALYILESQSDAQDAVQDLYVKLWNSRSRLDGISNPAAYGTAVLKNLCLDRMRHGRLAASERLDKAENVPGRPSPEENYIGREQAAVLRKKISALPENQQTVLRMRIMEEKSYEEISKETGLSVINLRVLLSMARNNLRK